MRFFASRIYDEDMCFLRDIMTVLSEFSDHGISIYVFTDRVKEIVAERDILDKFEKFTHYNSDEIKDCYPSDRNQLMKNARDIATLSHLIPKENCNFAYAIVKVMKKMGLTRSEKLEIITLYLRSTIYEDDSVNEALYGWALD